MYEVWSDLPYLSLLKVVFSLNLKIQMIHSGGFSSSNLFLKYKTLVLYLTPTAYSSVNSQKYNKIFKKAWRIGEISPKILPQRVNLLKLSREMTPHSTGQVLKHGGRRTLHLAGTWRASYETWPWWLCLRSELPPLGFSNRHFTNSKTCNNGRITQRTVTILQ